MEMNEILAFVLIPIAGGLLGLMFFGGLWWTIRRSVASEHPASWFLSSLLLRMSIAICGFYLISDGRWDRLLLCLVGFVIARLVVTWLIRPTEVDPMTTSREASHAP